MGPITLDFETEAIEARPRYPPKPVGFSLQMSADEKPVYHAWGHPEGNNTTFEEARSLLQSIFASGASILCHNAKFDIDVAKQHMGCRMPTWDNIHDTMYLLFLADPYAASFALKPSAERILGMPPTEQDEVRDWLVAAGICKKSKGWGAHICKAPGDLVGGYAEGDVRRTRMLFDQLYPTIAASGMMDAYDAERELMPILLRNETEGVRIDHARLAVDVDAYSLAMERADSWLRERLGVADLNIDSDEELADALDANNLVEAWTLTKTGKRSVSKENMPVDNLRDPQVAQVLGYRNRLATCLSTFMRPWLAMASATGGRVHTSWNQVRGSGDAGARTGRMSSSPNFQNIPKMFEGRRDAYKHPEFLDVPRLPLMRSYILPDEGQVLIGRDFSQQELRILAHFEDGRLMEAYAKDPRLDVHTYVHDAIKGIAGIDLDRGAVKAFNFGLLYGMGLAKLADSMGVDVETAKRVKAAHRMILPGVSALETETRRRGKQGGFITTWGGRRYLVEPATIVDGARRTFEYKLLNYLIQGSAADCTKRAMINYDKCRKHGRLLLQVHDELLVTVPAENAQEEMELLNEAMADVAFDVPMLSDGKSGLNWGSMSKWEAA